MQRTKHLPRLLAACIVLVAGAVVGAADDDAALRKKALALNEITGEDTIKATLKDLILDRVGSKKLLATAAKMVKAKDQPFNYTGALILADVAQVYKNNEAAIDFLKVCVAEANKVKSATKLGQAYGGLIAVYADTGKYAEAVKLCREILEMPPDEGVKNLQFFAWQTMLQALSRDGKADLANKELDTRLAKNPDNWFLLQMRGMVQRENGDYADAARTYEKSLDAIQKDKDLDKEDKQDEVRKVRYMLSNVYIDAKNVDKAASHLEELLKDDPENPGYNNDLGYIWADHDMKLDEAEKLIRKALEGDRKRRKELGDLLGPDAAKDKAEYLDSLGWVLFKKKKFKEALTHLSEAVKDEDGQHLEIYDHLGDVHMALGNKAEAMNAWKKAIESATKSKREQERKVAVEKKVKQHETP